MKIRFGFFLNFQFKTKAICCVFISCLSVYTYSAVGIFEFDTESQRVRYQQLATELRCPKCQNQNLLDSNSQISIDLRKEVARLIQEGKTDREVKRYLVDRYGDFVLYNPPVQANTIVLWWAPVLLLLIGVVVFLIILLRRRQQPVEEDVELNELEQEQLASWLDSESDNEKK